MTYFRNHLPTPLSFGSYVVYYPVLLASALFVGCRQEQPDSRTTAIQPSASQLSPTPLTSNVSVVLYDFVANFDKGTITPETVAGTPTGKGVVLIPMSNEDSVPRLTILTGYQYKSEKITIPAKSQLTLSYAIRLQESDGMGFKVFIYDGDKRELAYDNKDVIVRPPWDETRVSLSPYAGKTVNIAIEGYSPSVNSNYDWLAFKQIAIVPE